MRSLQLHNGRCLGQTQVAAHDGAGHFLQVDSVKCKNKSK